MKKENELGIEQFLRRKGDCNREPEKRIEEERRSVREALAAAKQTKRNVRVKVVGGNQEEQLLE